MHLPRYLRLSCCTTRTPPCKGHSFTPSTLSLHPTFCSRSLARMASTASTADSPTVPSTRDAEALADFHTHVKSSKRILALLGAGLSASSGLPTFRGAGGLWRTHDAIELATPEAFDEHPGLVWQFYNYRRHMALKAKPNAAHYALSELARKVEGFKTLSQNVDGEFPCRRARVERLYTQILTEGIYKVCHNAPVTLDRVYISSTAPSTTSNAPISTATTWSRTTLPIP